MDRFSQRLAKSLIADRHRAAAQSRRTGLASCERALAGALGGVMLLGLLVATVSAAPVERTRSTIDCDGADVTLVMHPGWASPVQWDISTDDPNAPSYIAKYIEGDVYIDGEYTRSFSTSLGEMVGFGEPISCTFEVHKPGFDAYGYTELVVLP